MNESASPSEAVSQALELGILLGQRRAFSTVAGRCTAAQIDAMRRMHDSKTYLEVAANWDDYCLKFMKVTGRYTRRLIACLREFGPAYFDLAQLTGITPAAYRLIAPAVQVDGIHLAGEIVALIPENADKAAEAVAHLLAEAEAKALPAPQQNAAAPAATLERRGRQVAAACAKMAAAGLSAEEREALFQTVQALRLEFLAVEIDLM